MAALDHGLWGRRGDGRDLADAGDLTGVPERVRDPPDGDAIEGRDLGVLHAEVDHLLDLPPDLEAMGLLVGTVLHTGGAPGLHDAPDGVRGAPSTVD